MECHEHYDSASTTAALDSDRLNTQVQEPIDCTVAMQQDNGLCPSDQAQLDVSQSTASSLEADGPKEYSEVLQLLPGLSPDVAAAVAARLLDAGRVTVGKKIGAGAFSTVYQAQVEGSSSRWVVKRLDRVGADQMQQLANEIEMLTTAGNHPNLVPFKGWYKDDQGVLCLVLGHCEGGALAALLKSRTGGSNEGLFPEDMVMCWFVQLLLALHHLHARRILHRDLKPENVLLSRNLRVAKLADFGISKQLEAGVGLAMTCLGTPHYMSPEVITHRPYTFASDMWALGVVLYEMACRKPAYDARGLPQLVVKILRNAYTPLPLACSRPLQQLVGLLLRADPDDRPTTTDLLGLSIVRKHVQLLVGLAQGVQRNPAPAAAVAAAAVVAGNSGSSAVEATADAAGAGDSGSSRCSTPRSRRNSSVTAAAGGVAVPTAARPKSAEAATSLPTAAASASRPAAATAAVAGQAATGGVVRAVLDSQCGYDDGEEVDLGGGLSVALQDMMIALRRMARAPLHAGAGGAGSPPRRSKVAAAAAAAAAGDGSSGNSPEASAGEAAQQQGDKKPRVGSGNDKLRAAPANSSGSSSKSRSNSLVDKTPAAAAAAAGSSDEVLEGRAGSPGGSGAASSASPSTPSSSSAAAYAVLPTPLAAPNTKRPVVRTWDATAQWEAQQRKQAELRYQAKVIEQRMAREQARQRRKESDPVAVAKAAQQQQELEALQEAQRKRRQQQRSAAAASEGDAGLSSINSISAVQAAAEAAQDEQLQLLLEQLRGGPGSSSSSRWFQADSAAAEDGDAFGDDDLLEEVEEEEGLEYWDGDRPNDDVIHDEDYTQALALAAGDDDGSSSSSNSAAAAAVDLNQDLAHVAVAGKRAWKLVVASLEGDVLAALLPKCKDTGAAAAAAVCGISEGNEQQSDMETAAAGAAGGNDLPLLIQSTTSPTASPRSQRRSSSNALQQQQQQQPDDQAVFGHLEQELEKALAGSNEAAAQEVISSIYRMSLSLAGGARCHQRSQRPSDASGTCGDDHSGTSGDTGGDKVGPVVMQSVGLWGKRVRPRSAADVVRGEKASAAFAMVVNQMLGNMILPEKAESVQDDLDSSSSSSSSRARLDRTVTGRPQSVPAEALRRRSRAAEEFQSAAAVRPAAAFEHQQQHLAGASILDGPGSAGSSRRSSRSSSITTQQQSQPRLAPIGGLTTSRPVSATTSSAAAAAAGQLGRGSYPSSSKGALVPAWQPGKAAAAAAGSGVHGRVGPGGFKAGAAGVNHNSQQAASATPRVDDALRILRGQEVVQKGSSSSSHSSRPGHGASSRSNSVNGSKPSAAAAAVGSRSGLLASSSRKQMTDMAAASNAAGRHPATGRNSSSGSSSNSTHNNKQNHGVPAGVAKSPQSHGSSSTAANLKAARPAGHSSNCLPRAGSSSGSSKQASAAANGSSSKSRAGIVGRPSSSHGAAGGINNAEAIGDQRLARRSSSSSRLTKLPSLGRAESRTSRS